MNNEKGMTFWKDYCNMEKGQNNECKGVLTV